MADDTGELAWFVAAAIGGALFDTALYMIDCAATGKKMTWAGAGKAALVGAATGVCFGAAGKIIKAASGAVKATKAGRVLWSGGQKVMQEAARYASKYGLKTLEQTIRGKVLQTANNALTKLIGKDKAYKLMRPLWDAASSSFTKGSNGTVHVFLNSQGIGDTSVFYRIEWQILKETGQKVVWHFVNGG